MGRTLLGSLVGAGAGALVGVAVVGMMAGPSPPRDTAAIALFVGTFLAGAGAIAGAIIGAVAEVVRRKEQAREARPQRDSDSDT